MSSRQARIQVADIATHQHTTPCFVLPVVLRHFGRPCGVLYQRAAPLRPHPQALDITAQPVGEPHVAAAYPPASRRNLHWLIYPAIAGIVVSAALVGVALVRIHRNRQRPRAYHNLQVWVGGEAAW